MRKDTQAKELLYRPFETLSFGERTKIMLAVLFSGENECGYNLEGTLEVPENLIISYINQDTSGLRGMLKDYSEKMGVDYTILLSLLKAIGF